MPRTPHYFACKALALGAMLAAFLPSQAASVLFPLSNEKSESLGWTYVNGDEYPGAKGGIAKDSEIKAGAKASLRLDADLSGGGEYVGAKMPIASGLEPSFFSFQIKCPFVKSVCVRLEDSSGQCFQNESLKVASTDAWQTLSISVKDLEGEEHWGGKNDGSFHPPAKALTVSIVKGALKESGKSSASLWLANPAMNSRDSGAQESARAGGLLPNALEIVSQGGKAQGSSKWSLSLGEEFPGAKGSLKDSPAFELSASFAGGGEYIAAGRGFEDVPFEACGASVEFSASNLAKLSFRAEDSSGQTFQKEESLSGASGSLEIDFRKLSGPGSEHWGGPDDGVFRPPAKSFSLVLTKSGAKDVSKPVSLRVAKAGLSMGFRGAAVKQTRLGSVFEEPETPSFEALAENGAELLKWKAEDFRGAPLAAGEVQKPGPKSSIKLPPSCKGFFKLRVEAFKGGASLGAAESCGALLPKRAEPQTAEDSPFGVCAHFSQGWPLELLPLIRSMGATEIRDEIPWSDAELKKGSLAIPEDWKARMAAIKEAKLKTLLILCYANDNYDGGNAPYTEAGFEGFARYGAFIAKSFRSQLSGVEVFNEWNSPDCFCKGPAASKPDVYLKLLKAVYEKISKQEPGLPILGCSTVGLWWGGYEWLEKVFASKGSLKRMSAVSFHPYYNQREPELLDSCALKIKGMMEAAQHESLPLWATEIGWPQCEVDGVDAKGKEFMFPERLTGDYEQACYLVRSYALLLSAGVVKIHWYVFMNGGLDKHDDMCNYGLIRAAADPLGAYSPKPAYVAYSAMASKLKNMKFKAEESSAKGLYRSCLFEGPGGEQARVLWTLEPCFLKASSEEPLKLCDLTGADSELKAGATLRLCAKEPVFIVGKLSKPLELSSKILPPKRIEPILGERMRIEVSAANQGTAPLKASLKLGDAPAIDFEIEPGFNGVKTLQGKIVSEDAYERVPCLLYVDGKLVGRQASEIAPRHPLEFVSAPRLRDGKLLATLKNISEEKRLKILSATASSGNAEYKLEKELLPGIQEETLLGEFKAVRKGQIVVEIRCEGLPPAVFSGQTN